MENLSAKPVQYLKGMGPKRAKLLAKVGISSIEDLLYNFPKRYEDRTNFISISNVEEGKIYTLKAQILACRERRSFRRRGFSIIEAEVTDKTGKISCVWFNQPYLKNYFKVGSNLILHGKIEHYGPRLQINSPEFELVTDPGESSLDSGRIVPVYSLPEGITQRYFRAIVKFALDEYLPKMQDGLAYDVRLRNKLLNLAQSLLFIHFPEDLEQQKEAFRRLCFEEFFLFQIPLALRKLKRKKKQGIIHKVEGSLVYDFIRALPFSLTSAQDKALEEIKSDLMSPEPMQRLLQGDVGSGKTVVATIASLMAIQGGYQVAFMVPTEILAKQHLEKIKSQIQNPPAKLIQSQAGSRPQLKEIWREKSKIPNSKQIRIELLTSSVDKKQKDKILREIKEGKSDLIIGTHALLEGAVEFKKLGLVVIDEQHKFGVGQRALLPAKGINPDCLIMTATPIPRTLAITLYGDLDVSVINELPAGRGNIQTLHCPEEDRAEAYGLAKEELRQGHQVYIIYPVIEESYALDIAGAKKMYTELKKSVFKDFCLDLVHGRLKQDEPDRVMRGFKQGKIDILVATTVLEVGIDIANATCMIIEHAQRFGLSQLHQLRGRIGRGEGASVCVLVSDADTQEAGARIKAMLNYSDGFKIAEEDLKIRGPGEFFGKRQHGLTELRIANPLTQLQLLKNAREEAIKLVGKDPQLSMRQNVLLKERLLQRFPEYEDLMLVG